MFHSKVILVSKLGILVSILYNLCTLKFMYLKAFRDLTMHTVMYILSFRSVPTHDNAI